jgi:hypothetical protein
MKLNITESFYKDGNANVRNQVRKAQFCCDFMMMAFANELIGYGNIDEQPIEIEGDERHLAVNIYQYDDESGLRISHSIKFCPFCGEPIEIEHN